MHGHITHFAINADDVGATRAFYEALFGWRFTEAYPGFWRTTDAGGAIGAIQSRRTFASDAGFEVTFTVDDADAIAARARGQRRPGADAEVADPGRGRAAVRGGSERERRRSAPSLLTQRGRTLRAPPRPSAAAAGQAARIAVSRRGPHWAGGTSGSARTPGSARDRRAVRRRVGLDRGDDPPRRLELAGEHALGRGRERAGVPCQAVAQAGRPCGRAGAVAPQAALGIEAVERQQLPAVVGEQVDGLERCTSNTASLMK